MDTRSVLLLISLLPGLIWTGSPCSDFTGVVAASPCSSYFISCRHGSESRVNCSHGLIFNPEKSQCDFKENIQSCKDQYLCTSGDGYFGVGCSQVYWLCRNGIPSEQVCPDGMFFNDVNFSCDLKIGVPACGGVSLQITNPTIHTSEGLPMLRSEKSKSLDCHNKNGKSALSLCNANYIECSKGVLSVGVCPSGSLFDSDLSSCVDANRLDYCVHMVPKSTMSPLENECTDLEDGVYSTGCSQTFFTCTHKTQHVFNCPSDLIYNEALELCDYRDSVQSCQGREADPVKKETVKNSASKKRIEGAWKINEVPVEDGQREVDCSSHPDGFYSSGCVSGYVSCIGGKAQKYSCGNLVFNSVSGICDYPDRCIKTISNRHSTFTPGLNDFPNAIDCSKSKNGIYSRGCVSSFTSCYEGLPFYGRCPEGLVYNQQAGFCDYVESCVGSANLEGEDAPGTFPRSQETEVIDCSIREDGFYSSKKCSPDFVACSNGRSQQRRCPDLLLFVDDFGYCDYPSVECDPMFEPKFSDHSLNLKDQPKNYHQPLVAIKSHECVTDGLFEIGCSSTYISCSNGLPTHVTCPNNLVFNPSSKVCDYSCDIGIKNDVPVFDNSVNGINNPVFDSKKCDRDGPLPGQTCLPSFYVCFHGYRVLQNCPSALVYSDHMQRCEYPDLCKALAQTATGSPTMSQINLDHKPSTTYSSTIIPSNNQNFFRPELNNQNTNDFSCLHRRDGLYSLGGCYGMYAMCASGRLSVQNCPNSLVFDALTLSCEKQCISGQHHATHATNTQNSENENICLRGKRFALGQCKSAFLECSNGQQIFKECPSGTTFDIIYGLCIYDSPNCKVQEAAPAVPIYQQPDFTEPQRPAICEIGVSYPRGDCKNTYLRCVDGYNFEQLACFQDTRFDPISLECKDIFLISSCVHHEPSAISPLQSTPVFPDSMVTPVQSVPVFSDPMVTPVQSTPVFSDSMMPPVQSMPGFSDPTTPVQSMPGFSDPTTPVQSMPGFSDPTTPVQSSPVFSDPIFLDHLHYGFRRHHAHHRHNSHSGKEWVRDGFQGDAHRHSRIISNPFYQGRKYVHGDHHYRHHNHGHDHHHHRHRYVAYDHVRPHHRRHSVRLLDSFDGPKLKHTLISNPFYDKRRGKSRRVRVDDVFKRIRFPITDSIYAIFPPSHHRGHHRSHHRSHHRRHGKHHKRNQKDDQFRHEMFEGSGYDDFEQTEGAFWKNLDVFNDVPEEMENSREESNDHWRRKRYADVSPSSGSVLAICQPGNANQAVAVGYCQQSFVYCTGEFQQLVAACPVGESFDSVLKVCSNTRDCGTVPTSVPQQTAPVVIQPHGSGLVSEENKALPYSPLVVNNPVQPVEYQPLPAHLDQEFLPVYQKQYDSEALDGYNAVPLSQPQFLPAEAVAQPYVPQLITTPENQRHTVQSDQTFHPVRQQQYEPENSLEAEEIRNGYIERAQPLIHMVPFDSRPASHLTQPAVDAHFVLEQQQSQQKLQTGNLQQNSNVDTQSSALRAQGAALTKADTGCTTRPDGIFALGCSSTFVTCVGGISYVSSCPSGLVFDGTILACNYPEATFCNNGVSDNVPVDQTFFEQPTDLDSNIFLPAQLAHAQQEQDVFDSSANWQYQNSVVNQEQEEQPPQFIPEFATPLGSVGYEDVFQSPHIGYVTPYQMVNIHSDGQPFDETIVRDRNFIHNKYVDIENQDLRPMIQSINDTHVVVFDPAASTNVVAPPPRFDDVRDHSFVLNNGHRIPNWLNSDPVTYNHNDDYFYKKHSFPKYSNFKYEQTDADFLAPTKASMGEQHQSFGHPQYLNQQQSVYKGDSHTNFSSPSKNYVPVLGSPSGKPTDSSATSQIGASEPILSCSARSDGGYFLNCDGGFIMCVSGQMYLVKCAGFTNFNETTQKCEYVVGKCKSVPGSTTDPYTPIVFEKQIDDSMEKATFDGPYHPVATPVSDLVPIIEHKPFSGEDSPPRFSHAQDTKPYTPLVVPLNEVFGKAGAIDTKSVVSVIENFDQRNLFPTPVLPYHPSTTVLPYRPSVTELPDRPSVRNKVVNHEPIHTSFLGDISEENSTPELLSETAEQDEVVAKIASFCLKQNVAVGDVCESSFYVCSYGVVKKMLCSSGEVFNPTSASCDPISNIPECNVGSDHSLEVSSKSPLSVNRKDDEEEVGIPSYNPIRVSTERVQTAKYTISAADVTKVSGVVEETTLAALRSESGMSCDSENTSVFPIAHCHITYAVCESTGFARAANCSPSYLFDHALFKCVPSEECGNLQIKEYLAALHSNSDSLTEVCEDAHSNEMRALGECSRSYVVCGTRPSVERCSLKSIFVQSKQKCIDRENVAECLAHEKILPKTVTTTQATFVQAPNEHINVVKFCTSRDDGYYRNPEKCTGVVQCFNGEMIEHSPCPSGLVFNNILNNCDYPVNIPECSEEMAHSNQEESCVHGAHIADDKDCSIYYRCVWNRKIKMDCPENTVFNPKLAVCDYIDAVPHCNSHNIDILDSELKSKIADTLSHLE